MYHFPSFASGLEAKEAILVFLRFLFLSIHSITEIPLFSFCFLFSAYTHPEDGMTLWHELVRELSTAPRRLEHLLAGPTEMACPWLGNVLLLLL